MLFLLLYITQSNTSLRPIVPRVIYSRGLTFLVIFGYEMYSSQTRAKKWALVTNDVTHLRKKWCTNFFLKKIFNLRKNFFWLKTHIIFSSFSCRFRKNSCRLKKNCRKKMYIYFFSNRSIKKVRRISFSPNISLNF